MVERRPRSRCRTSGCSRDRSDGGGCPPPDLRNGLQIRLVEFDERGSSRTRRQACRRRLVVKLSRSPNAHRRPIRRPLHAVAQQPRAESRAVGRSPGHRVREVDLRHRRSSLDTPPEILDRVKDLIRFGLREVWRSPARWHARVFRTTRRPRLAPRPPRFPRTFDTTRNPVRLPVRQQSCRRRLRSDRR